MSAPSLLPSKSQLNRAVAWSVGGPVLRPFGNFLGCLMVVAGPWLISIIALAIISVSFEPALGRAGIEDLRLTVIYALCLAPLVAGPIGAVVARLMLDSIDAGHPDQIGSLYLIGLLAAAIGAFLLALLTSLGLGLADHGLVLAFVFLTVASAALWVGLAALAALRAYAFMLAAFAAGMTFSVAAMFLTARKALSIDLLAASFTTGLLCFVMLTTGRMIDRDWPYSDALATASQGLWRALRRQRVLILGICFALLAVWVDKWVFWFSPDGVVSEAGFRHFGPYDSVMFVAHLSVLPAFAAMALFHDGALTRAVLDLRQQLSGRAPYNAVQASAGRLTTTIWGGFFRIAFRQGVVAVAAVLLAPTIVRLLDFDLWQFFLLRISLLSVFLHALIYLSCTVLVICGRIKLFCLVQGLYFACNLCFSLLFYAYAGITAYGFFAASLLVAPFAFASAYMALSRYVYFVLVGENSSLYRIR